MAHVPGELIPLVEVEPGYLIVGGPAGHRLRVIERVSQPTREGRRRFVVCADGAVRTDLPVRDDSMVRFVEDGLAGQDRSEAAVWALVKNDQTA